MSSMESMATPTFADFARRQRMIGVHADLCRQVERHGQAALPFAEQVAIARVRFRGAGEARILPHGPEAAAIHRGINAARIGKFAGIAKRCFRIFMRRYFPQYRDARAAILKAW